MKYSYDYTPELYRPYSGVKMVTAEADIAIRRYLGLPITKQLHYYKDKRNENSKTPVTEFQLIEKYDGFLGDWYTVEITLTEGETRRLHSDYFKEMQAANFVKKMKKFV